MCGHYAFRSSSPKTPAYINNITSNTNIAFVSMTINVVGIIGINSLLCILFLFGVLQGNTLNDISANRGTFHIVARKIRRCVD